MKLSHLTSCSRVRHVQIRRLKTHIYRCVSTTLAVVHSEIRLPVCVSPFKKFWTELPKQDSSLKISIKQSLSGMSVLRIKPEADWGRVVHPISDGVSILK